MAHRTVPSPVPVPLGQVSPGQASPEHLSPERLSPGQISPGQISPGQISPGQVPRQGSGEPAFLRSRPGGLWPGTTGSAHGTPPRRPGSVRRTTSIMMERPDGLTGSLRLTGVGRDLLTTTSGATAVLGTARLRVVLDYMTAAGPVLEIESDPAVAGIERLVGASARSGFRGAARAVLAGSAADPGSTDRSLLEQLLDDVPVATLVSGSALARNGVHLDRPADPHTGAGAGGIPMLDVCAGWQRGGQLAQTTAARLAGAPTQRPPLGVQAGDLRLADDPLGWHPLTQPPVTGLRRLRRIDVTPLAPGAASGPAVAVDAFFRDSYQEAPDSEIVVHEYGLGATVDAGGRILTSAARAGVLPGFQCPEALGSAGRIVGMNVAELRRTVARTFTGTTTCTHLNDTLRSVGDLPTLLETLASVSDR